MIRMKLVDNLRGIESYYLVISGNGTFPEKVILKSICWKYNGHNNAIFYISTPLKKQTGLNALNAIKLYPKKYQIKSIIFIVDGEHIKENANNEIIIHLESKGIEIKEIIPLQGSSLIKCKTGPYNLKLYSIILGPEVFIEEEVTKLIKTNLNIQIDLSHKGTPTGRKDIKKQIKKILRENGITIKQLVDKTRRIKLEQIFPNLCAVIKIIEEEHEIISNNL